MTSLSVRRRDVAQLHYYTNSFVFIIVTSLVAELFTAQHEVACTAAAAAYHYNRDGLLRQINLTTINVLLTVTLLDLELDDITSTVVAVYCRLTLRQTITCQNTVDILCGRRGSEA